MRSVNFVTYVPVTDNDVALTNLQNLRRNFAAIGLNIKWYRRKNVYAVYLRNDRRSIANRMLVKTKAVDIQPMPRSKPAHVAPVVDLQSPTFDKIESMFTPDQLDMFNGQGNFQ